MKVAEIFQVETPRAHGNLASVLNIIAEARLMLEHVSRIRRDQERTLWELTVEMDDAVRAELLARQQPVGLRVGRWGLSTGHGIRSCDFGSEAYAIGARSARFVADHRREGGRPQRPPAFQGSTMATFSP